MTQPGEHHLADETLSASLDDQLTPDEASTARAHLETCAVCRARLDELRSVVGLLRSLPSVEPPRRLFGLRLVADPPNVVRLRRWYTVARAGAASLAAVFVFASAGAVYVSSQTQAVPPSPGVLSASSATAPAQVPAAQSAPAGPTAQSAGVAAQSAPAAPPAPSPPALAARSAPAANGAAAALPKTAPTAVGAEVADLTTATTSVRPLPTQVPTAAAAPQPTSPPPLAAQPVTSPRVDTAAPLWTAAAIAGVLAALGLVAALLVRRRLHLASHSVTE